jgi:DNA-binding transcriptional ArsR family regulator
MREYKVLPMPRAATTTDVFNAIAEPGRREIIDLLIDGREHAVGDVVIRLRMPQPAVSKHLGVLRKVGVVTVSKRGQMRMYRLNAKELKPIHDWVKMYERYWTHQLDRIKQRAEIKMLERAANPASTKPDKEKP